MTNQNKRGAFESPNFPGLPFEKFVHGIPSTGEDLRNYPECRLRSEDDDLIPMTPLARFSALYYLSVDYSNGVPKIVVKPESNHDYAEFPLDQAIHRFQDPTLW